MKIVSLSLSYYENQNCQLPKGRKLLTFPGRVFIPVWSKETQKTTCETFSINRLLENTEFLDLVSWLFEILILPNMFWSKILIILLIEEILSWAWRPTNILMECCWWWQEKNGRQWEASCHQSLPAANSNQWCQPFIRLIFVLTFIHNLLWKLFYFILVFE